MNYSTVWGFNRAISGEQDVLEIEKMPVAELLRVTSVYELIARSAEIGGDSPAIKYLVSEDADERVELSYRQVFARLTQAANALQEIGVRQSDAVSILLPGTPDGHIALWAAASVGCACPINYFLAPKRIAELICAARSRVLILQGPSPDLPIWEKLAEILEYAPAIESVIVVDGSSRIENGIFSFSEICSAQPSDQLKAGVSRQPHDTVALFHTGGTTGVPKLARHTAENQLYTACVAGLMYGSSSSDRVLNGLPIYHVAGSLIWGLTFLAAGSCLVLPTAMGWRNGQLVADIWNTIDREKITIAATVPTNVAAMASAFPVGNRENSLRIVVTGGAPLARTLADDFEARFGAQICELYGMTETAGIAAITPALQQRRPGAAGMRLPYERIEIRDPITNEICGRDETGVIHVRGPNIFPGYVDQSQNVEALSDDGFLCSGDLGHLDDDGWLHVTGRKKDLIIRGGHNIDPGIIEDAFFSHPEVSVCAAVGQIDAYAGEVPVAFVVLKPFSATSVDQLMAHVTSVVGEPFARPREIYLVDALPTTAVGKVIKRDLRLEAADRAFKNILQGFPLKARLSAKTHYSPREIITATITVSSNLSAAEKADVEGTLTASLRPFAVEFSIDWRS